jgi:phosphate transport system permease protein
MNASTDIKRLDQRPLQDALMRKNKRKFLGTDIDGVMRTLFTGNAWVAFIILGLITFSLFKEGLGFFPQHLDNLRVYRQAGLEYVDIVREQHAAHGALLRFLQKVRQEKAASLVATGAGEGATATALAPLDELSRSFDAAVVPLDELLSEMTRTAAEIKERHTMALDAEIEKKNYLNAGMKEEADAVVVEHVDFQKEIAAVRGYFPRYLEVNAAFAAQLREIGATVKSTGVPEIDQELKRFQSALGKYIDGFPGVEERMKAWDQNKPYSAIESFTRFVFGSKWVTQSFWQDWYGFLPLFIGSLCISFTALLVAVPFGVGAAIYVNQLANPAEAHFIKPYIEFISAIPSVVLGFFGIAVLGETIRLVTQMEWLAWVPFFPISERLNIVTAGLLLGLMAVPTIFTLSEDAINNVPRAFKEASFALGANRLQTIVRIIVPAALSGIISAVLLGFGRVIGETMVVLMCAGNRIEIPDFTQGLGAFFLPVHTMTGIIAQEIPEVPKGVLQYRALFMLAIMLFFISLAINYVAQLIVKKYRISIG